jgi:hypothetical protein
MRIDSSGNVLVGKTSATTTTSGVEARANGLLGATRSGTPAIFNRLSTDGTILAVQKDGTTVGSIGVSSSGNDLYIGNDDVGLRFSNGGNYIAPYNATTQADSDGSVSLGYDGKRFTNLYLSGGVYLGGTGSANKLDDYEEGTFTPVLQGAITAGSYTASAYGRYRKIGDMVSVWVSLINITGSGGSGAVNITGLPFTINAAHGQGPVAIPRFRQGNNIRNDILLIGLANSSTCLAQYNNVASGGGNDFPMGDIASGNTDISFNFSYTV